MPASAKDAKSTSGSAKRGPFAAIALFIQQVIDELRKVVWPTRNELWTYFFVVVVFVTAIMLYVGVLDAIFERLVTAIFA
ncbi:preprotein translocase subunit SecE [Actinomyces vulturis]|uniref:preprotein translocase subunit SecE n=1 Tax=Actinomyces vulturis TaxID=1857645 RepID=UPI00082E087F|nr:preprotein translocase subunit SecE [Actinomyces vulturis]